MKKTSRLIEISVVILVILYILNFAAAGDINNDKEINSLDYVLVKNHVTGKEKLNSIEQKRADVNKDGSITKEDYKEIENIIMNE